jgi:hypothetical protein
LNPGLSALNYSARIGGSGTSCGFNGDDNPERIVVDSSGQVFVTGFTSTSQTMGFPVTPGAFDTTYGGNYDAFVLAFDPDPFSVTYASYLGGANIDVGKDIAIDSNGKLFVTGYTFSSGLPVCGYAFDKTLNGDSDAFFSGLDPQSQGSADLYYGTYLGGNGRDWGVGLSAGTGGGFFLTGLSTSTNFPVTAGGYQGTNSGDQDAYITLFPCSRRGSRRSAPP